MKRTSKVFTALITGMLLAACSNGYGASTTEIDAKVKGALKQLYQEEPAGEDLARKAAGILVIPDVIKAGIGVGGEYGEGALIVGGKTAQYYRVTGLSIGFQLGGQAHNEVIMFMTDAALNQFRQSEGWEAGVDGSVAIVEFGVGKTIDTNTVREPIIGFVFGNKGLMYDLSLKGSKYWKINKGTATQ